MAPISSARLTALPEAFAAQAAPATDAATFFSSGYPAARARFCEAAQRCNAATFSLPITARGPGNEALSIDIAWLGAADARRVLVHVSGIHGVEAYAGSATQLRILASQPPLPADGALVLVHVLNPYGMAWLRRANEHNVDLNRNFLPEDSAWTGAPPLYRRLDQLLNPPSLPARDGFVPRLAMHGLRHGVNRVKQAIAHGQHHYPRGLFYGGAELQPGPRVFCTWLRAHLAAAESVFVIDMHTGLGAHGESTLITEPGLHAAPWSRLGAALGKNLQGSPDAPATYTVRGGFGSALPRLLPRSEINCVVQEIGTWSPLRVLHALREENRWHHHGDGGIDHASKRILLEALCPASPTWRKAAVAHGDELTRRAAHWLFNAR